MSRKMTVKYLASGRAKYPFKAMIIGDYFLVKSGADAQRARSAALFFSKRDPPRVFKVRESGWNEWTCERVQ